MKKEEKIWFWRLIKLKLFVEAKLSSQKKISWNISHKSIVLHSLLGLPNCFDFPMEEIKLLDCGCGMDAIIDTKDYFVQLFA